MGRCEACEVDPDVYFLDNLGVGFSGIEEEIVESLDLFDFWETSVLVDMHEFGSKGVGGGDRRRCSAMDDR